MILLQLDQECLDVYKRKVDQASKARALLLQALDDSKIELARLLSALGEKTIVRTVSKLIILLLFQIMELLLAYDHWSQDKAY